MSERDDRIKARVKALATEAHALFKIEHRTSNNAEYWTYDHHATPPPPEWLQPLCLDAHDAGQMSPDDWRYAFIVEALAAIAEAEEPEEIELEADTYAEDLGRWLGSHGYRAGYCDEAAEQQEIATDTGIIERLQLGQAAEKEEVLASVLESLRAIAEAEEPDDDQAEEEEEEADEPEEEDLITEDHIHFFQHGGPRRGPVFTVQEGEDWKDAAARWMNANQFYPSVWWISDHGNAHRMSFPHSDDDDRESDPERPYGGPPR